MASKISYQTWSGGSGEGDKRIIIGFCKEPPLEVLKRTYRKYYIHRYKDLYIDLSIIDFLTM